MSLGTHDSLAPMGWLPKDMVKCDNCPLGRQVVADRQQAIQLLRAGGWRHLEGKTEGGQDHEVILCPGCAKEQRRRSRGKETLEQDALPLDWEKGRIVVGRQGISSR